MSDQRAAPRQERANRPLLGRRALVVEASSLGAAPLNTALADLGAETIIRARSGREAIDRLRARPFDIVVIGQVSGDVYDSTLLLERIREDRLLPLSSTLVTVASDRTARTIAGLAAHGPDACLIRPLVPSELRVRLSQLVGHKDRLQPVMAALDSDDWASALEVCRLFEPEAVDLRLAGYRSVCEQLLERGLAQRAQTVLAEVVALADAPWMRLVQARIERLAGRNDEARDLLERLVGERPNFIASYEALAGMESESGKFASALRHLQEATGRSGFSLRRARGAGEAAARGGDLQVAEKMFEQVMERVHDSELVQASDYVGMVDVLSARGKHRRAEKLAVEMRRTQAGDPDGAMAALLARFRRAQAGDDAAATDAAFGDLVEAYRAAATQLSLAMVTRLMETFAATGERELALDAARTVAASGQADRARLDRVREVLRT